MPMPELQQNPSPDLFASLASGVRGASGGDDDRAGPRSVGEARDEAARQSDNGRRTGAGADPVPKDATGRAAVAFVIPGEVVGKGRARSGVLMRGGKPVMGKGGRPIITHHTPEKTVNYEALVKLAGQTAMAGKPPIEGAVFLAMRIYVVPPASWSNKKRAAALAGDIYPTTKPDVDNVEKAISDGLNEIVWVDDKQVVDVVKSKRYAETAGVHVEVTPL
jgi:Holliday junction resolvase RusA-like endonuclease